MSVVRTNTLAMSPLIAWSIASFAIGVVVGGAIVLLLGFGA